MEQHGGRLVLGKPEVRREAAQAFGKADQGAEKIVVGLSKSAASDSSRPGASGALAGEGLKASALVAKDLPDLKRSDPRKLLLAEPLWKRTTVPQEWISEKLAMRSSANVSQQLHRFNQARSLAMLSPEMQVFHKPGMKFGNVTGILSRFAHGPNFFLDLPGLDFVETYLVSVLCGGMRRPVVSAKAPPRHPGNGAMRRDRLMMDFCEGSRDREYLL